VRALALLQRLSTPYLADSFSHFFLARRLVYCVPVVRDLCCGRLRTRTCQSPCQQKFSQVPTGVKSSTCYFTYESTKAPAFGYLEGVDLRARC
jgi:hypothetical protein